MMVLSFFKKKDKNQAFGEDKGQFANDILVNLMLFLRNMSRVELKDAQMMVLFYIFAMRMPKYCNTK